MGVAAPTKVCISNHFQTSCADSEDLCFKSKLNFLLNIAPQSSCFHFQHHHSTRNSGSKYIFCLSSSPYSQIKILQIFFHPVSVEWTPFFLFLLYSNLHNVYCTLTVIIWEHGISHKNSILIPLGTKINKNGKFVINSNLV